MRSAKLFEGLLDAGGGLAHSDNIVTSSQHPDPVHQSRQISFLALSSSHGGLQHFEHGVGHCWWRLSSCLTFNVVFKLTLNYIIGGFNSSLFPWC